ncbi:MAG: hypothetical protein FI709_11460 [SAR202 cluster bacterium]|nr:hypothetical protein [SAR202 cluster bacterium]
MDWRTVKAHLQKMEDEREQSHWEDVAQQLDSQYLDEHYAMLRHVAVGVSRAVRVEPLFGPSDQTATRLLVSHENHAVTEFVSSTLQTRGVDLRQSPAAEASDQLPDQTPERMTKLLADSLFEHEPILRAQLDHWCETWERLQENRREFTSRAVRLCKQDEEDDESAERIGEAVAHEVMIQRLQGQPPEYPTVQKSDGDTCTLVFRPGTPGDNTIHGSARHIERSMTSYEETCQQMSIDVIIEPVKEAYRDLVKSAGVIEDIVDRLILTGRPSGRCSILCPSAFAGYS